MSDPTAKTVDGDLAPADNVFGFDPASVERLPLSDLLRRMGPGFILAGIQLGPGSLTTSAMLGGDYAYQLLWVLLPVIFMGTTFILAAYRLGMATGKPTIDAIREYYGNAAATFVGLVTFFACVCFNIGNVAGIGAGMSLIFGIDWKIGAAIVMVFVFLCYFLKGVYGKIEKAVTVCIAIMAIAFIVVLVMTGGPDAGATVAGLTQWQFPEGSLVTVLGFLGSSASVLAGMYGTYLGVEKEWKKQDLFNGVMVSDALAQVLGTVVISGVVIIVGAIVPNLVVSLVYGQAGSRLLRRMTASDALDFDDDERWRLGLFYVNREDPSVVVPRRFGVGWAMNWGNPKSWGLTALLVVALAAFVVLIEVVFR